VLADALLLGAILISFLMINVDVMSETKMALPLYPLACVAVTIALTLRVFYDGRSLGTPAWRAVAALVISAATLHWIGLTFVTNGPGEEWAKVPPASLWIAARSLRSDLNPNLSLTTFFCFQPVMLSLFLWLVCAGAKRTFHLKTIPPQAAPSSRPKSESLIPEITMDQCNGCAICLDVCPQKAIISGRLTGFPERINACCDGCGICKDQCPTQAITLVSKVVSPRQMYGA
jgi:Pyruvate/2-oxoacid:ferredoxin oxidoreductase delta subunit